MDLKIGLGRILRSTSCGQGFPSLARQLLSSKRLLQKVDPAFYDASPLSDTTIISSMAAVCDHVDHVNTQLPYTLLLAGLSLAGFIAAGLAG